MDDPVWGELGRIDYFLDHLARAVERGDVPAESYERLAPRYLERRSELAHIIELKSGRVAAAASSAAVPLAAGGTHASPDAVPASPPERREPGPAPGFWEAEVPATASVSWPRPVIPQAPPQRRPPQPSRPVRPAPAREPVAVSTLLAYVGALLVIVAVAIFTVYNWESFSPQVKLAALLGVTLAFYAGGESVRVGLKLPVIGVALLGVGSAMLLFDGWMLITALRLTGALPWALVLLGCSIVYWLTEIRVAGNWFGVFGAAAQVAWWWLLGRGLGWAPMPSLAVLALVGLGWTLAGMRAPRLGPIATLGATLRAGGPLLAGATVVGSTAAVAIAAAGGGWGYPQLAEAAVVGVIAAAVLELTPSARAVSALGLLPIPLAAAALRVLAPAGWVVAVAVLAALALGCVAFALVRGGAAWAAAAVAVSVVAVALAPAGTRADAVLAVYAALAFAWLAASRLADRAGPASRAFRESSVVWGAGAPALAAVTSFAAAVFVSAEVVTTGPGYVGLASALAVGLVCTSVIEWRFAGSGFAPLALLPVFAGVVALRATMASSWTLDVLVLVLLALGCAAFAVWRGGPAFAVAAVAASVLACALGPSGGTAEVLVALVGCVALVWLAVSRLTEGVPWVRPGCAPTWEVCGLGVLALASAAVPVAGGGLPLAGAVVSGRHALLAVAMPCAWVAAFALRPRPVAGWAVYLASGYAVAAVLAFAAPGWPPARYAVVLTLLALAWSQAQPLPERLLGIEGPAVVTVSETLLAVVPAAGLSASSALGNPLRSWDVVGMLAVAALAWVLEGVRRRRLAYPIAAGIAVAAAADGAATAAGVSSAAVAAAATAFAIAGTQAFLRRGQGAAAASAVTAGAVATCALVVAFGVPGDLSLAMLLLAGAWAAVAVVARTPELALAAGILLSASGFAALHRFAASPPATVAFAACAAAALLAPTAFADRAVPGAAFTRASRAAAYAGAATMLFLVALGMLTGASGSGADWWFIGWQGAAAAFALLGVYVLVWSGLEGVEGGLYAGLGLFVVAYWVVLFGRQVGQAEWFLVPAAVYAAAMGYLWASREPAREVPQMTDVTAVIVGLVAPFLLAAASFDPAVSFRHGMWALGIAASVIVVGLTLRVRVYFLGGLAVAALDALWLSRDWLFALPKWLIIGALGLLLIGLAVGYARRQSLVGDTALRMRDALADWR